MPTSRVTLHAIGEDLTNLGNWRDEGGIPIGRRRGQDDVAAGATGRRAGSVAGPTPVAQRSPLTERGNRYGATRKASERLMSNQFAHNVAFQFGGGRCLPSDLIKTVFARRPLRPSATGRV